MGHRVELGRTNIAETTVHRPHPDTLGNFLLTLYGVALVGIEILIVAVLVVLIDIAVSIHLIIHLSLHTKRHTGQEQRQK